MLTREMIEELRAKIRRAQRLEAVLSGKGWDPDYLGELVEVRGKIGALVIRNTALLDAAEDWLTAKERAERLFGWLNPEHDESAPSSKGE